MVLWKSWHYIKGEKEFYAALESDLLLDKEEPFTVDVLIEHLRKLGILGLPLMLKGRWLRIWQINQNVYELLKEYLGVRHPVTLSYKAYLTCAEAIFSQDGFEG